MRDPIVVWIFVGAVLTAIFVAGIAMKLADAFAPFPT